jgi:hypothetical protein
MKATRLLVIIMMHLAPSLVLAAQSTQPLIGQVGKAAFAMDIPAGWVVQKLGPNVMTRNADALFRLTQGSPGAELSVTVAYFKSGVPSLASTKWEQTGRPEDIARRGDLPRMSKLSHSNELSAWYLTEAPGSQFNAYTTLGDGVVVVGLLAQGSDLYEEGKRALLAMLDSYREVETRE